MAETEAEVEIENLLYCGRVMEALYLGERSECQTGKTKFRNCHLH